jgi:exopolysaccharide biosynthesis polyprenyl glycosylphosphotransferase
MTFVEASSYASSVQPFLLGQSEPPIDASEVRSFARSKSELRFVLFAGFLLLDICCIVAGFLLAGFLRLGSPFEVQEWRTLSIVLPTFIPIALNSRAYSIEALNRPTFGARKALEALLCASAVALALLFYMKIGVQFSRVLFAAGTILSVGLTLASRILAGKLVGASHDWRFSNELILADGVQMRAAGGELIVSPAAFGVDPTVNDPLTLDRLGRLAENCDRVIVACAPGRRAAWMNALKGTNFNVEIAMPELGAMGAIGLGRFRDDVTLLVNSGGLSLRHRMVKRALDLVVASASLILVAPLMALVAIAIAVESRGPVLFRQPRVGHNNRIFSVLKFRSMRLECTDREGNVSACAEDQRLTRVGKFIRRTSIDELPQLLNVLAGDMSIVGPRPHALGSTAENLLFWQIDPRYSNRHAIKPGITGLAQVRGFRGATVLQADLTSRLKSDLEYVAGWSIWRDLKIMLATFRVLVHPNAF